MPGKKVFARVDPGAYGAIPSLALAPYSTLAAMADLLGFTSAYQDLEANLIAKINNDLANGIDDPADIALLTTLLQNDEDEMEQYASGLLGPSALESLASAFETSGSWGGGPGGFGSMADDSIVASGLPGMTMADGAGSAGAGGAYSGSGAGLAMAGPSVGDAIAQAQPSNLSTGVENVQPVVAGRPVAATGELTASDPTTGDRSDATESAQAESKVIIVNPEDSGGSLSYVLAGAHSYTIDPGFTQALDGQPSWLIEFDRGGSFGQARYTIGPGTYTFTATENGWELYNTQFTVVLDNSANETDFSFVKDGQVQTIAAGASITLADKYAIVVSFDRGDGGEPGEKTFKSGTYRIGVNEKTNLLDLEPVAQSEISLAGTDGVASR
jgi:hypothetical protein